MATVAPKRDTPTVNLTDDSYESSGSVQSSDSLKRRKTEAPSESGGVVKKKPTPQKHPTARASDPDDEEESKSTTDEDDSPPVELNILTRPKRHIKEVKMQESSLSDAEEDVEPSPPPKQLQNPVNLEVETNMGLQSGYRSPPVSTLVYLQPDGTFSTRKPRGRAPKNPKIIPVMVNQVEFADKTEIPPPKRGRGRPRKVKPPEYLEYFARHPVANDQMVKKFQAALPTESDEGGSSRQRSSTATSLPSSQKDSTLGKFVKRQTSTRPVAFSNRSQPLRKLNDLIPKPPEGRLPQTEAQFLGILGLVKPDVAKQMNLLSKMRVSSLRNNQPTNRNGDERFPITMKHPNNFSPSKNHPLRQPGGAIFHKELKPFPRTKSSSNLASTFVKSLIKKEPEVIVIDDDDDVKASDSKKRNLFDEIANISSNREMQRHLLNRAMRRQLIPPARSCASATEIQPSPSSSSTSTISSPPKLEHQRITAQATVIGGEVYIPRTLNSSGKPIKCPSCDKVFFSAQTLRTHFAGSHAIEIQCPICPTSKFNLPQLLSEHLRITHKVPDDQVKLMLQLAESNSSRERAMQLERQKMALTRLEHEEKKSASIQGQRIFLANGTRTQHRAPVRHAVPLQAQNRPRLMPQGGPQRTHINNILMGSPHTRNAPSLPPALIINDGKQSSKATARSSTSVTPPIESEVKKESSSEQFAVPPKRPPSVSPVTIVLDDDSDEGCGVTMVVDSDSD